MLVITRLPTHRNDGSKVSRRELRAILTRVRDAFGGYTLEGPFQGAWVADDGGVYEETSYRLEVVVRPKQLADARPCSRTLDASSANARFISKSGTAAKSLTSIEGRLQWRNEA